MDKFQENAGVGKSKLPVEDTRSTDGAALTYSNPSKSAAEPGQVVTPIPSVPRAASPPPAREVSGAAQPEAGEGGEGGAVASPEVLGVRCPKAGKGGEGGAPSPVVSNAAFIAAVFHTVPEGATVALCSKSGDPTTGPWLAQAADQVAEQCPPDRNNYFNISSFKSDADGSIKARKDRVVATHSLVLDDVGTKIDRELLGVIEPSWVFETSPKNFQIGFIFERPLTDAGEVARLQNAVVSGGLCDPGAIGNARWSRLPEAINGKEKCKDETGRSFACIAHKWNPHVRYTVQQIFDQLKLEKAPPQPSGRTNRIDDRKHIDTHVTGDVYTPKAAEHPILTRLKEEGLYKCLVAPGKHEITCPWVHEHTDELDSGAVYFEPDAAHPVGGFRCQHSHGDRYNIRDLVEHLDITWAEARNRPVIRLIPGEMDRVIDAAERVLADRGNHYQSGGLIVSVAVDALSGDPSIVPTSLQALTKELSAGTDWEKYDGRSNGWVRCDPPQRHVSMLYESQSFHHIPPLAGLARQPYFRESGGGLVMLPGYDVVSQLFGVFDPGEFELPEPTLEAARAALSTLEELISEFHFAVPTDRSAALAASFTAVVRPSLPNAPGFHVKGAVYASGKTLLCEVTGAFAGPGHNLKVSYPKTSEEATKAIQSLLLTGPAVVEFDDMDTDWIPHGILKRAFTAERITDRILGVSKVVTVSTRTLFLGSGNNVGPVRDLLRRVLTINVDPRCATPATLTYSKNPVEMVRASRGRYVAAVLTVILAWRKAGSPRSGVPNIATYGGAWSDYCRHPLIWLGHPDPASTLFEQIRHDPDSEVLGVLMTEWTKAFGSKLTTVRKALNAVYDGNQDLHDALLEFPVADGGRINTSKLGWLLKKNANRIVGGFQFQRGEADGRTAWAVLPVTALATTPSPASPPLPASTGPPGETVRDHELDD